MTDTARYGCACCGRSTLARRPGGTYQVCPVCYWEDDAGQLADPSSDEGANDVSLEQARANFQRFGSSSEKHRQRVRAPNADE